MSARHPNSATNSVTNLASTSVNSSTTQQQDVNTKLKQIEEKLLISEREYRKLNERYLTLQRK